MNTNAWVRITETLAQAWKTWLQWDQVPPEPPISDFGKEMLNHVIDYPFSFQAYKPATIDMVAWRMGNFHQVTVDQMQQGYTEYPNEWEVIGMWCWQPGEPSCLLTDAFPWKPDEALLFMPDKCADPPDCTNMVPATEVEDVSLLAGQPPRKFN